MAKKSAATMFRQGDVLLIKSKTGPKKAKVLYEEFPVLASGKVTGHSHRVNGRAKLLEEEGESDRFLEVEEDAVLEHEEHAPIQLGKGCYLVRIQKEYSPEAVRNVED